MKISTSELIGPALDWAVAKCEGETEAVQFSPLASSKHYFAPSRKWSQGGPLIEREKIDLDFYAKDCEASIRGEKFTVITGPTPLIAAMRAYVTINLGDEVEVPDDLL